MSVPSQFPSGQCRIAFIGEAPGADEVRVGQPFVGSAGKIFNQLLHTANLNRSEFYIGNVFNEKLPDNNIAKWCVPLGEARKMGITSIPPIGSAGFLRADYYSHLDRLRAELECVKPTVIVPLGGTALWALTGDVGITSARGNVSSAKFLVPGTKLIPTFHPMAVMHQWKLYSVVVGDLIKANVESGFPEIRLPTRELILEPSIEDITEYLARIHKSDLLSVDIETGWGQITCIGFAPDSEHAITIPFFDKRMPNRNYWSEPGMELAAWKLVRDIMDLPVPKLGQNFGGYDAFWLLQQKHIFPRNYLHDTRLLHHALYPELPKDLEFLGASYGTQGAWKSWGRVARHTKRDD
jgi:DNA polymerase